MKKTAFALIVALLFSLPAQAQTPDPAPGQSGQERPYGCFRDLRWGMSKAEVEKSLNVKLRKRPLKRGGYSVRGGIDLAGKHYALELLISNSGLYKVELTTFDPITSHDYQQKVQYLIGVYQELKPDLIKRFGNPQKVFSEDKISDPALLTAIIRNETMLMSFWETQESTIILNVEFTPMAGGDDPNSQDQQYLGVPQPILTYQQKRISPK